MTLIPLICRVCESSRDTLPHPHDPHGTVAIFSRCFDCGQKAGHDPVIVEYLDISGNILHQDIP